MQTPVYRSRPDAFAIAPASQPAAERVADRIWLSEGLSNAWLVTTPAGRVVINTGMGFEAPVHKRNFDAVDASPVRYVILTQGHVDHVGGVDHFLEEGTELVAQAANPAHQADDARIAAFRARRSAFAFADAIAGATDYMRRNFGSTISPQARPVPTLVFDDRLEIELGGVRFELLSTPGGETLDSLVVWLPDERTCFAGNLFSALFGHFPNLVTVRGDRYREALRFVESAERVRALAPERLLVGHGPPIDGRELIGREIERICEAVRHVHDETVRGMNQGRDVFELMRDVRLPPELEVGEGYGKVSWSVRAIWETYAGWFQHRSTTELYGVPPERVHGDLVELAGGPDALVARAGERLCRDQPTEALALVEIALGAAPGHRASLELAIRIHEGLEKESRNFWLTSWLREQRKTLSKRLEALGG